MGEKLMLPVICFTALMYWISQLFIYLPSKDFNVDGVCCFLHYSGVLCVCIISRYVCIYISLFVLILYYFTARTAYHILMKKGIKVPILKNSNIDSIINSTLLLRQRAVEFMELGSIISYPD